MSTFKRIGGRKILTLSLLALGVLGTQAFTGPAPAQEELAGVEAALNNYLFGSRDGDVERLRAAFHPSAEIEGIRDGALTSWTAPDYVGGARPGQRREFEPRILSVDITGDAAQAKVECDYGTWKFVDYMQLLKVDGEWKIMNKVYHRVVK